MPPIAHLIFLFEYLRSVDVTKSRITTDKSRFFFQDILSDHRSLMGKPVQPLLFQYFKEITIMTC